MLFYTLRRTGDDGMILKLNYYERNVFYFDCFLSAYDREMEYLFIGGFAALRIANILHFISDDRRIESYSKYLILLESFFNLLQNVNIDFAVITDSKETNSKSENQVAPQTMKNDENVIFRDIKGREKLYVGRSQQDTCPEIDCPYFHANSLPNDAIVLEHYDMDHIKQHHPSC